MTAEDARRAEALFCSDLDMRACPNGSVVRCTVTDTLAAVGEAECAARMAQAYGDDPTYAAVRMRWALLSVGAAFSLATIP
ncbi:hypothetical protein ACIA5D_36630 [Actinoplanes sp. NPDC051513]|uniref:hypothetical protein n=1 Tax=Actinoplanes sp. NPDC051513 TaxID=3363908 RepID=UPI00378CF79C